MRWIRDGLGILLLIHISLSGCATTEPQIKPPKMPEEYMAPPENDPRYDKPIEYPKEVMGQDALLQKAKTKDPAKQMGPTAPTAVPMRGSSGF
jgi:hypothetical protein